MTKAPIRSEYLALPWSREWPSYEEALAAAQGTQNESDSQSGVWDYLKNMFTGGPDADEIVNTELRNELFIEGLKNLPNYMRRISTEPFNSKDNFIDTTLKSGYWIGRSAKGAWDWLMDSDEEPKENPVLAAYKAQLAGGGYGGAKGVGAGDFPEIAVKDISIPNVDYSALRKKIQDMELDTTPEVANHNWLTAFGNALANVDLTSNLAGDWSKAADIMAKFDYERNHDEVATKNRAKQQKAEFEMWKTMKDIALQEAEQNQAYKQAQLSLQNQQRQAQAAMWNAKARAFYGGGGAGGWTGGDKTKEARTVGLNSSLIDLMEKPDMTMEQAAKKAKRDALMLPQKDQVPYILGYMQQYAATKGALSGEGD